MEIPKTSISFRCSEKLKSKLDLEAVALGATRSDLCEQRIAVSYNYDEQLGELRLQNQELEIKNRHLAEEVKKLKAIDELTRTNHFIRMLEQVRGKVETIVVDGVSETIQINSPYDLLRILTFSYRLKKC